MSVEAETIKAEDECSMEEKQVSEDDDLKILEPPKVEKGMFIYNFFYIYLIYI